MRRCPHAALGRFEDVDDRGDISNDLLFIDADIDDDGGAEPMSLFDERLRGIVWQFDENGMRRAQLRFYPIE